MLKAENAGYEIDGRWLVRGVSLGLEAGEFCVILGPNGAGKSTLLRMLSGQLATSEGRVCLEESDIRGCSPKQLARRRACLEQHPPSQFPFTVRELVAMGRYPHQPHGGPRPEDQLAVAVALARTGTAPLAVRQYPTLSGGEAMRTNFARILAQSPQVLLLDEPTNHLDPFYQHEIMELCRALAREGCAVLAVLHDINLASLYADRFLLMKRGRVHAQGKHDDVFRTSLLEQVFGLRCEIWRHPDGAPWVVPCGRSLERDRREVSNKAV